MTKFNKKACTIFILFVALFLFTIAQGNAATKYIRQGSNGSGNSWADAYGSFSDAGLHSSSSSAVRGNTYYVASGDYGSVIFKNGESGSSKIVIKKATSADHGTSTGWDSSYGIGAANFKKWTFYSTGYELDGQIGAWAPDLPKYESYGFKIFSSNTADNQEIIETIKGSGDIIIRHVEGYYTTTPRSGTWYKAAHIVRGYGGNYKFYNCWFHDAGNGIYNGYLDNVLFDRCVLERNGQAQVAMHFSPSEHSEIAAIKGSGVSFTFSNSYMRDWRSTGGFVIFQTNAIVKIFGSVIAQTGYYSVPSEANDGNGALTALSHDTTGMKAYAYNNTFVNLSYGAAVWSGGVSYSVRESKNNIFYNCDRYTTSNVALYGSHDYNWFYNSGSFSESHIDYGSKDIFANYNNNDFRLLKETEPGDSSIGSTFSIDQDDMVRAVNGSGWDRGAFEYNSEYVGGFIDVPGNFRVISQAP